MAEAKQNKMIQKKEKRVKERDSGVKAITTALKALPPEEQVSTLLAKYAEIIEENKKLQVNSKTVERQVQILQRDKDQLESEHTKVILAKSKLESLCRELQKQNKLIKEENLARLREEEERRKEVSTKFNVTLSEISNLMKENSDKNSKLRDENQDMATRLQELIKQYESRESDVQKMVKQKELQCQLSEARMAKQQIEMTEDREKMLLEKKTLLEEVAAYQQKTQQMSLNEISLRTQLNSYMEKYEDFQKTLEKSNKIFHTFKKEMEEMAKKIKKTEKDTKSWKERWEGANNALLEMVTERSQLQSQFDVQVKQNKQLENLCRALQQQVTEFRSKEKNQEKSEREDQEKVDREEYPIIKKDSTREETSFLECPIVENNSPNEEADLLECPILEKDSAEEDLNFVEMKPLSVEKSSLSVMVTAVLQPKGNNNKKMDKESHTNDACTVVEENHIEEMRSNSEENVCYGAESEKTEYETVICSMDDVD